MSLKNLIALMSFSLVGIWRRWLIFAAVAIHPIVLFTQLPRFRYIADRLADPNRLAEGLGEYALLVSLLFGGLLTVGMFLSLGLGTAATGSRRLRSHLLLLLARPVSRGEFVTARAGANTLVLALFWLVPLLLHEVVRGAIKVPVHISPWAFATPFFFHVLILALGLCLGTLMPALPATLVGIATLLVLMILPGLENSSTGWLALVGATFRHVFPPLLELWDTGSAFSNARSVVLHATLYAQAIAWTGVFLLVAVWRFERIDFTARDQ